MSRPVEVRGIKRLYTTMEDNCEDLRNTVPLPKRMNKTPSNMLQPEERRMYNLSSDNAVDITQFQAMQNTMIGIGNGYNNFNTNGAASNGLQFPANFTREQAMGNGMTDFQNAFNYRRERQLQMELIMQHNQLSNLQIEHANQMMDNSFMYNPDLNARQNPYYYESNKILFELYATRMRRSNSQN